MFPPNNLEPQSSNWVRSIQSTIEALEKKQSRVDKDLDMLQRENGSVLAEVSSNVNAYYTDTMAQYPAFSRTVPLNDIFGGSEKTVSISAPAAADASVSETWVSMFTHVLTLPAAETEVGIRLNSVQFRLRGPSAYYLRFRWRINSQTEGLNVTRWLSRHEFNLSTYAMDPTAPVLTNVTNRYAYWTGASASTVTLELQASIQNIASSSNAVASQNVTMEARDNDGNDTYLDVMITV